MNEKAVLDLAKKRGRDKIFFTGVWRGFSVYRTGFDEDHGDIGLPLVILEKDGTLEAVNDKRSFEIIDALIPNEDDE